MIHLTLDDQYAQMPWDEIDAVVFDIGNVLLRFMPGELLDALLPDRKDLHDELMRRVFRSPYWVMMDRGSITVDEAVAAMSTGNEALAPYVRTALTGWYDLPWIAEGIETLKTCKAHGKKLYALSNYPAEGIAYIWEKADFFRLFDGKVISSSIHMVKPCREIYDHLTAKFGLNPARTLFIDDTPANIEAALEAGWQGVCYNREGKLHAFFADQVPAKDIR